MRKIVLLVVIVIFAARANAATVTNALTITTDLKVENGSFKMERQVNAYRANQTVQGVDYGITTVNGTTNTLPVVNVTASGGYSFFRNLGTNSIVIQVYALVQPNDVALFRVNSTNITAYTTTADTNCNANLEWWINAK